MIIVIAAMFSAITIVSCGGANSSSDATTVGDTFNAESDAGDDATGGINGKASADLPVTSHIQAPEKLRETPTIKEKLFERIDYCNLKSAAWSMKAGWVNPPDIITYPADNSPNPADIDIGFHDCRFS